MRFSSGLTDFGRWGIQAEMGLYDAIPPTQSIFFDVNPSDINSEVEAVAMTILFGRFSGGELSFPNPISPHTASMIQEYLAPVRSFVAPIEFNPRLLPQNSGRLYLKEGIGNIVDRQTFLSLRADEYKGAINTKNSLAVSNNTFMLKENDIDMRPGVASAILFSMDLGFDTIAVPIGAIPNFRGVRRLLASVRIKIEEYDAFETQGNIGSAMA